jgi:hypothetical protein
MDLSPGAALALSPRALDTDDGEADYLGEANAGQGARRPNPALHLTAAA